MAGGAGGTGDLAVGDVTGQHVPERVLGFAFHGGTARRSHELLAGQLMQDVHDVSLGQVPHRRDRAGPEHLPDHSGVGEEGLAVRWQGVQAGRDQGLHSVGERDLSVLGEHPCRACLNEKVLVLEEPDELLGIQRVTTGPVQDRGLQLGRDDAGVQQRTHQPGRLGLCQRNQVDRGDVA